MSSFYSILFKYKKKELISNPPEFFNDLNLDQIIEFITSGKDEYELKPYFYTSLHDIEDIKYRQQIMTDLENPQLFEYVKSFARGMQNVRNQLSTANKLFYQYHKERIFLDIVEVYCEELISFEKHLTEVKLNSSGLSSFRLFLREYLNSDTFKFLQNETKKIKNELLEIKYCVRIKDLEVQVKKYNSEPEYENEIEKIFAKFKQNNTKSNKVTVSGMGRVWEMNHIEAKILEGVAVLFPEPFERLDFFINTIKIL